ncbi:MAG: metallophosphoesterase [Planctomycetaceae bacterium]|nr:metallophosphoesterase [Planctomycetaceae bacterium]
MRIGLFADAHDHLDYIRKAVAVFNDRGCELVLFAGDLVSSFAVPPLRELRCPVLACFGDNEGNRIGVAAGFRIIGQIGEPPFGFKTRDGVRIVMTHMLRQLVGAEGDFDVCVFAHTHRAEISRDEWGRLYVNPGETSGWSFRKPSVAILETSPLSAEIVRLDDPAENSGN